MFNFCFVLFCVALIALSAAQVILMRRVKSMEKAFYVAAERLVDDQYV